MNRRALEARIVDHLRRDRAKPYRCHPGPDGIVVVQISGTTAGLVYALELQTGEDGSAILCRLGDEAQ